MHMGWCSDMRDWEFTDLRLCPVVVTVVLTIVVTVGCDMCHGRPPL